MFCSWKIQKVWYVCCSSALFIGSSFDPGRMDTDPKTHLANWLAEDVRLMTRDYYGQHRTVPQDRQSGTGAALALLERLVGAARRTTVGWCDVV